MTSRSMTNKLHVASWEDSLYLKVEKLKESLECGEGKIIQLVGDNWEINILPSYRTSQQKT